MPPRFCCDRILTLRSYKQYFRVSNPFNMKTTPTRKSSYHLITWIVADTGFQLSWSRKCPPSIKSYISRNHSEWNMNHGSLKQSSWMNRNSKTEMNDLILRESQPTTLECYATSLQGRDCWRPVLILGTSSNVDLVIPVYFFRCAEQDPKRPMFNFAWPICQATFSVFKLISPVRHSEKSKHSRA